MATRGWSRVLEWPRHAGLMVGALVLLAAGPAEADGTDTGSLQLPDSTADLLVYVGRGCPHCARALAWLETLTPSRPDLRVAVHDVATDPAAREVLARLSRERGLSGVSVPTFVFEGRVVQVGFDSGETTGRRLESLIAGDPSVGDGAPDGGWTVRVPVAGPVRLESVGLPAFTAIIGLVDGFNPCAMWVLLFLLSILVSVRSRARMVMIGGVFVLVSGVVYYAFMAAWLNAFLLLGMARWIQVGLGGVAIVLGALNVKDAFWMGRGPSLGIPDRAKPGIYARMRRIVTAERLGPALGAVVVLAALVNTVELLCTAGLPALYTRILTLRELSTWAYHGYLALYNVFYMLDDALVLVVAIVTLSHHRLQRREARGLKLVSGVVMLGLGLLLIAEPAWLVGH